MLCTNCGSALAAANAPCTVCDPWAAPSRASNPAAAAFQPMPVMEPLPKWLDRVVKRNPPQPANLTTAWRNSVIQASASAVFYVLLAVGLVIAIGLQASDVGLATLGFLFIIGFIGLIVTGPALRRKTWLPRAVAVVGTRPDIGYDGFARIPAIARLTSLLKVWRVVIPGLLLIRVFVGHDQSISPTLRNSFWLVYWLAVAAMSGIQFALLSNARKDLDKLLRRR